MNRIFCEAELELLRFGTDVIVTSTSESGAGNTDANGNPVEIPDD